MSQDVGSRWPSSRSSVPPGTCGGTCGTTSGALRTRIPAVSTVLLAALLLVLVGCDSGPADGRTTPPTTERTTRSPVGEASETADGDTAAVDCSGTEGAAYPDVVGVELKVVGERELEVAATLCSAYDTPERYADAWRVRTPEGEVLGVRELLHDHADEQPFTRSLSGTLQVPPDVDTLVVEGRDLANGWGGATVEVDVPGA